MVGDPPGRTAKWLASAPAMAIRTQCPGWNRYDVGSRSKVSSAISPGTRDCPVARCRGHEQRDYRMTCHFEGMVEREPLFTMRPPWRTIDAAYPRDQLKKVLTTVARSGVADVAKFW
jgi:hypothetical protein